MIPLGITVKVLDASFLNLHIGHATVLLHQPLHGLLALRSVLVVLPQEKLHPAQQGAGGQFCGRDGKVDRLMLNFFLHRYHLLCRKSL